MTAGSGDGAVSRRPRTEADDPDTVLDELPPNAPTWFALLRDDLELPPGSAGYVLESRPPGEGIDRLSATNLVGELARWGQRRGCTPC